MWVLLCYAFVFLSEGITAWTYLDHIFTRTTKFKTTLLFYTVGYVVLFGISQIESVVLNGVSSVLINGIILFSNYSCKKISGILQLFYLTSIMAGSEFLVALLLSLVSKDFAAYSYDLSVMIAFAVASRLLYFFVMQISARCIKPVQSEEKDKSTVLLLTSLPVASVWIILTILCIGMTCEITPLIGFLMTGCVLILLVINLLVSVLYNYIQKINSERLTMELQVQKEKADTEFYTMLQTQYENQRVLIHDVRGHLQVMYGLVEDEKYIELQSYITQIEQDPGFQKKIFLSDNSILNSILTRYYERCRELTVEFICDVRSGVVNFMRADDVTTLFENLLSNALEAARDSKEKLIDLSVTFQHENSSVLIVIENTCDRAPTKNSFGEFITWKANRSSHGIGLKSINRIVEKYHGIYKSYYDDQNRKFHSIIQMKTNSK